MIDFGMTLTRGFWFGVGVVWVIFRMMVCLGAGMIGFVVGLRGIVEGRGMGSI